MGGWPPPLVPKYNIVVVKIYINNCIQFFRRFINEEVFNRPYANDTGECLWV